MIPVEVFLRCALLSTTETGIRLEELPVQLTGQINGYLLDLYHKQNKNGGHNESSQF